MTTSFDLSGKTAFVTGASSGLGRHFATVLAANGARVALASRRVERLKEVRAEIEAAGGSAMVVALDVTDRASITAAVQTAEAEAGPIDILVNNSGVTTTQRLVDVTPEDFDFVMDTNLKGAFFVAQAVGKRMIERARVVKESGKEPGKEPGKESGKGPAKSPVRPPSMRIINIGSLAGLKVLSQIGVYSMSKAALIHMTRAMALEWGRYGINVTAICPGYVRTELNSDHWETEGGRKLVQMLPRRRLGRPEDLDGVLLMLASDRSDFLNGTIISADDGFSL